MKPYFVFFLLFLTHLLSAQISIYTIQYTTNAGDGTYPSPLVGEIVTTGGIVTVNNYNDGRYFISTSQGGAWNGLFVYDNNHSPQVGDSIIITGLVYEYNGLTELKDITNFEVISSSNALPEAFQINTSQVNTEPYESVFVEIANCHVTQIFDDYDNWRVDDGSGECILRSAIFNLADFEFPLFIDYPFLSIAGIVMDYYGICLLPRSLDDIQSGTGAFVMTTPEKSVFEDTMVELPIKTGLLNQSETVTSFQIRLLYNDAIFEYNGYETAGTLSENGTFTINSGDGVLELVFSGNAMCNGFTDLIKLKFVPIDEGNSDLQFEMSVINDEEVVFTYAGELIYQSNDCNEPQADTLTIIQRPIINIPSIVSSGDTLSIECFAAEETANWEAELIFNDITVDLEVFHSIYSQELERWTLQAIIPSSVYIELYDLHVKASGGLSDTASNAVNVIDQFKDEFYFIHITDTHLPGHSFYGEDGYESDESEMDDFREVIKDINLLNPEFVLLTGDVLNEGEMENFECLRHHTKVVNLLQEFEVPVFIVPGNHDLGGWEETPPSRGTARREWWRFFGWRKFDIPPAQEEYYVHDYSFDYGNVHFTGLESSDNYDHYLFDIYGEKGFIPYQLEWLENDLASAENQTKVLFYHYDFNNDLDLYELGVDMALWGHTHSDTDDFTHPFNIGTDNVCDGTCAYRVIRVDNGDLTPEYTVYAGNFLQNVDITYSAENNGTLDSLSAIVVNNHNQPFSNAIVKFIMPHSDIGYEVFNGTLQQVIPCNGKNICYVNINLQTESEVVVSIKENNTQSIIGNVASNKPALWNYPNPFQTETRIEFAVLGSSNVELILYNAIGQKTKILIDTLLEQGIHWVAWSGKTDTGVDVPNGVYFCELRINGKRKALAQIIYNK